MIINFFTLSRLHHKPQSQVAIKNFQWKKSTLLQLTFLLGIAHNEEEEKLRGNTKLHDDYAISSSHFKLFVRQPILLWVQHTIL